MLYDMLDTLEIEDICKIDVSDEIRLSVIRIEFQMPRQCTRTTFFLPSETEKAVSFLEDISKDKTIDHAFTLTMNTEEVKVVDGYMFHIVDSKGKKSNITTEIIDAIKRLGEKLRRGEK
jgi:hypothetical protein